MCHLGQVAQLLQACFSITNVDNPTLLTAESGGPNLLHQHLEVRLTASLPSPSPAWLLLQEAAMPQLTPEIGVTADTPHSAHQPC